MILLLASNIASIYMTLLLITEALVLVRDGFPNGILTIREFATSTVAVFEDVDEFPLIWCVQGVEVRRPRVIRGCGLRV